MYNFFYRIASIYYLYLSVQSDYYKKLRRLLGFTPRNLSVYNLAFRHSSAADQLIKNNERLEFLGDAVLDMVIAQYLFKKYPKATEGFLTEMRSKIVSRKKLGEIGGQMELQYFLEYNKNALVVNRGMLGNALEALVGAVYLDAGYLLAERFVNQKIIKPFIDLEELQRTEVNYKSKLLEWSQKETKNLEFELINEKILDSNQRIFTFAAKLDGERVGTGQGLSKKSAQKNAAQNALERLKLE